VNLAAAFYLHIDCFWQVIRVTCGKY